jgi:DegV family protein with EDD domain
MKIAVITDSSCNLDLNYIKKQKNLKMTPLMISFDGDFHRDLIEVDYKTVYSKLDETKVTSSLPSMEDFETAVNELKKAGYTDIIVITISSGLSGTFNGFNTAAKEFKDINIHMYDSKTLSMALGYMVKKAITSINEEKSVARVIADLNQLRYEDSIALFTVETLKYLRQGGRIGKVEGTIGDLLHVKPVIFVSDEGVYETLSKGFGINRTLITMRKEISKKFGDKLIDVTIHYGNNIAKAESLKLKVEQDFNTKSVDLVQLTPVLGIHTGPNMFAIIAKLA